MTKLAFTEELIVEPLVYAIRNNLIEHPFQTEILPQQEILQKLLFGQLDMAIVSPMIYAMNPANLTILKEPVVSSIQPDRNYLLFFDRGLDKIETVYYKKNLQDDYPEFFGKLVLREYYNILAEWIEVQDGISIAELIKKYHVLFLSGDDSLEAKDNSENFIDLSEEWFLKTSLPLVHRFIAVRENCSGNGEIDALKASLQHGMDNLFQICSGYAERFYKDGENLFNLLNTAYTYSTSVECWDSLKEIFAYLFYYGYADYPPEIKFYGN